MTAVTWASSSGEIARIFFVATSTLPDGAQQVEWPTTILIWILIAMGLTTIGLILSACGRQSRKLIVPQSCVNALARGSASAGVAGAKAIAVADHSDLARIVVKAIDAMPVGKLAVVDASQRMAHECVARRMKKIELLRVLAHASGGLGLLGTLYGVLLVFWSSASAGHADTSLMAGGTANSLVTTFWGLVVAIPGLIAYSILRKRIDESIAQALEIALATTAHLNAQDGAN